MVTYTSKRIKEKKNGQYYQVSCFALIGEQSIIFLLNWQYILIDKTSSTAKKILQTNIKLRHVSMRKKVVRTKICWSALEALKFDESCFRVTDTSSKKRTLGF